MPELDDLPVPKVLYTPFTRSIHDDVNPETALDNYTDIIDYDIFALKSRLTPIYRALLGRSIDVRFARIPADKSPIVIELYAGTNKVSLSAATYSLLQDEINEQINKPYPHALVLAFPALMFTDDGIPIDSDWITHMAPYLDIPHTPDKGAAPFITTDGIYVDLSKTVDFGNEYNALVNMIVDQYQLLYAKGLVADIRCANIAVDWSLVKVDIPIAKGEKPAPLYRPDWQDLRLAPDPVKFINQRLDGERFIKIRIDDNNVVRHAVSRVIDYCKGLCYFQGKAVFIIADNLSATQRVVTNIFRVIVPAEGMVLTIHATRPSWLKLYSKASENIWIDHKRSCTSYLIKDIKSTLVYSCTVPIGTNLVYYVRLIKKNASRIVEHLRTTLKTENIHGLIEQPDFVFPEAPRA
jgi:hypothetical protein